MEEGNGKRATLQPGLLKKDRKAETKRETDGKGKSFATQQTERSSRIRAAFRGGSTVRFNQEQRASEPSHAGTQRSGTIGETQAKARYT